MTDSLASGQVGDPAGALQLLQLLQPVLASQPIAQFVLRGDAIVWANGAGLDLCGAMEPDAIEGRSLTQFLPDLDGASLAQLLMGADSRTFDAHWSGGDLSSPARFAIGALLDSRLRIVTVTPTPSVIEAAQAIRSVTDPVTGLTGEAYLLQLLINLAEATGAAHAFVGELDPAMPASTVHASAVVRHGAEAEAFSYPLEGTPCADVHADNTCIYPFGVADLFPDDAMLRTAGIEGYAGVPLPGSGERPAGALVLLFEAPVRDHERVRALLEASAVRAAAELQRIHFELRLARSEHRYRSLVENSEDGLFVQRDAQLLYCNPAAAHMLGFRSPEELCAEGDMVDHVAPEDRELVRARARARAAGEEVENHYEVDAVRRDGSRLRVQISSSDVEWEGEPALQVLVVDVTARAEKDARTYQAQRMESLGKLTGGIAHDFNNLLAVILGNLELLAHDLEDREDLHSLIGQARIAAERGADLTARLLAFARRQSLTPQRVDLPALLQETRNLLARVLGEHIEVEIRHDTQAPVHVDPGQLQTAIINLAINARDAMQGGGRLVIGTTLVPLAEVRGRFTEHEPVDHVCIEVVDTGEGIDASILDQVFEPFFTTKSSSRGSGLGLSMVHGFVKQSRGHVDIDSRPGSGTRVRLYLPVHREDGSTVVAVAVPEPQTRERPLAAPRGRDGDRPLRALVVEDESSVREVAVAMLRGLGFEVFEASDGSSARRVLESETLDLLLSDVVLPGGQRGPDIALDALAQQPRMAVLFMSGYVESSVFQKFRAEHEFSLIRKPFRLDELRRRIDEVLADGTP
ncbi:MAG TPA: ATP-binding protein [Pseudomonadales bacterium]|nr:ATP-binding protein [Pseudomonadales bacterium]